MKINCQLTNEVVSALQANNIKCFIVGGYVRDNLLGVLSKDIDIELHGCDMEQAFTIINSVTPAKLFGKFGVISLDLVNTEFALARTESKSGNSHTDFDIEFISNCDLKLAASRRDFTINSIMYDLQTNEIIDLHNGIEDLNNKLIRHVSKQFIEDPLRVLRAIKFAARYNFAIDTQTYKLCLKISDEIRHLPKSRIENELKQIFNSKYFPQMNAFLAEVLSVSFNMEYDLVNFNQKELYCIDFFRQFKDYDTIIECCYEKKKTKSDLSLLISNYEQIINLEQISSEQLFDLLTKLKYVRSLAEAINPKLIDIYLKYDELCLKYNGKYFTERGYTGKAIAEAKRDIIKGALNEL